jgi:hypothetical protein
MPFDAALVNTLIKVQLTDIDAVGNVMALPIAKPHLA